MKRCSDDRGMGGVEVVPFGFLVFILGTLLVTFAWGVVDAKVAMSSAAREAARAYVEAGVRSPGGSAEAEATATDAARRSVADHGRSPATPPFHLEFAIDERSGQPGFRRCNVVTATASYDVPVFRLPWVGGTPAFFTTTARHREVIDPLRSGVVSDPRGQGASCDAA